MQYFYNKKYLSLHATAISLLIKHRSLKERSSHSKNLSNNTISCIYYKESTRSTKDKEQITMSKIDKNHMHKMSQGF